LLLEEHGRQNESSAQNEMILQSHAYVNLPPCKTYPLFPVRTTVSHFFPRLPFFLDEGHDFLEFICGWVVHGQATIFICGMRMKDKRFECPVFES
jgi:hypothetical protein